MRVIATGPHALVEDLGRPRAGSAGAPISGAFDRDALRLANRLVGNDESAAGIELVLGGAELETTAAGWIAVAGATGELQIDGFDVEAGSALRVQAGSRIRFGAVHEGIRRVLAVRGGIDAPLELGSRATDIRTGVGRPPLAAGDVLTIGAEPAAEVPLALPLPPRAARPLRVLPGPRAHWFTPGAHATLVEQAWVVGASSSRVGVHLEGRALERAVTGELESEGMLLGAIQVTPTGLVVLGPDHPTTGGYPVIAVVVDADVSQLAQARPGSTLRLRHAPA